MSISIHAIYAQIFKIWRRKRFALFEKLMAPAPGNLLLDVGGYPAFWTSYPQKTARIDTLNIYPAEWNPEAHPGYNIRTLVGNGCALDLEDKSYDIAYSNSVIEHVGSWENQQAFASEIRRVGKALWIQTPAFECPIEPHYMAPFVHYLPASVQRRLLRWCSPWGILTKPSQGEVDEMVATTRLIKKREMEALFPDCEIHVERLLWVLPKSYVAIRK